MNTHYAPTNHPLQLLHGGVSEQAYHNSVEENYSRDMYDMEANVPSDHRRRPGHLPSDLNFGYLNEFNYQSGETPAVDSPDLRPLYELSETPIQKEYLDPEMCDGFTRGMNIHKSNFLHTNPSKISQSCSLQKAQRDLDWKLKSRMTPEDLISKGILLGGVEQSPNILQSRIRLERAKTSDILKKKILARPSKGKLIDVNILKEFSGSPRLHQSQMSILKKQKMQRLNEKISERPGAQSLIKRGILCPPAPSLSECLRHLQNHMDPNNMAPNLGPEVGSQGSLDQFIGNPVNYPSSLSSTQFDQTSPSSAHSRECEISRERVDQLIYDEASPREADCTIIEDTDANSDNSALNHFTVSSKFQSPEETNPGFKRSLSKKISIRNPPNESTLKKDLSNSSSLKTKSSKRPRKGVKTYKYHEYIPCNNSSGNGMTKSKILEKTQLTKIALTESKGKGKSNVATEVEQEQLLLQLHLLRQQYPSLLPKIYSDLVTQLSQIEGKSEEAPKRSYTLEEVEGMTVSSLKSVCKENNVPSTGKKAELLMRLRGCKGVVVERVDMGKQDQSGGTLDSELSRQDIDGQSPGSKSGDDPSNQGHSPGSHLSELAPDQINTLITSPLSVLSQYSGASSDSYASENCSSAGKMAAHALSVQRSEGEDAGRIPDRDQHNFSNELDCAQGVDAVKYLDDSLCQIRSNSQMCMEKNAFHNSQLQRHSDEIINTNSHLNRLQSEHTISATSSLPSITGYQPKIPSHPQNKMGVSNISDQSVMSDFLHQLDSFDTYETNINRSVPTHGYGQRSNQQYSPYYPGDIQGIYPDKPMDYFHDSSAYLDLPYPDGIPSCPGYPLDMMDWNTPSIANDPYALNEYNNYDFTPMGIECIGNNPSLQNSIFQNSMNNSIEQDLP